MNVASWNDRVIEEFRANDGVLGGPWEGKSTLLLHSPGRKSGKVTVNPLVAAPLGTSYVDLRHRRWRAGGSAVGGQLGGAGRAGDHRARV